MEKQTQIFDVLIVGRFKKFIRSEFSLVEESLNILRPIYYLLSTVALFNVVYLVVFLKRDSKSLMYVTLNTLLISVISIVLFYFEGHIIDALVMSSNSLAFYSIVFIFLCFLLCLIFPLFQKHKSPE